jgi:hypothetical protein
MKKAVLTILMCCAALTTFAQGTVTIANTTGTRISTNATAIGGGTGKTGTTNKLFYYGLFTAPYGTVDSDLTSAVWSFTGLYATNSSVAGVVVGGGGLIAQNWPAGVTNSFLLAGWSSILGHDWSAIEPQLIGGGFSAGEWLGNWNAGGFYGQSSIAFGMAGGGTAAIPAFNIFGPGANQQGTPITNGFALWPAIAGQVSSVGPIITRQPVSTLAYWGKSASFTVQAAGTAPLVYQWYHETNQVSGATSSNLVLSAVQLSDAGNYSVVVTNGYGIATSSNAFLSVNPAGVSLGTYAGLMIDGAVSNTYAIQFSSNFITWTTLTNLTLTQDPELWVDTTINLSAPGHPAGSYRVMAVP